VWQNATGTYCEAARRVRFLGKRVQHETVVDGSQVEPTIYFDLKSKTTSQIVSATGWPNVQLTQIEFPNPSLSSSKIANSKLFIMCIPLANYFVSALELKKVQPSLAFNWTNTNTEVELEAENPYNLTLTSGASSVELTCVGTCRVSVLSFCNTCYSFII
jgi:hypothetical protein